MTFGEVLDFLSYYIDEALISKNNFNRISSRMTHFPASLSQRFGFESILNCPAAQADFSFSIAPEKIVALPPIVKAPGNIYDALSSSDICKTLKSIWLEFDSDAEEIRPGLFLEFHEGKGAPGEVAEIAEILMNEDLNNSSIMNTIESITQTQDCGTAVRYVGYFPGRKTGALRLSLTVPGRGELDTLLKTFYNQSGGADDCVAKFAGFVDYFILNVDIKERVLPTYSIEFRLNDISPEFQKRWYPFLDLLYEQNICHNKKYTALKKWHGQGWELFHPLLKDYYTLRLINHIKVTFRPDTTPIWKAYFGFINEKIKE